MQLFHQAISRQEICIAISGAWCSACSFHAVSWWWESHACYMASITACLCGKVSDGCVELKACFCYSETGCPFLHGMEHYNFHASNVRSSLYVLCSISLCMSLFAGSLGQSVHLEIFLSELCLCGCLSGSSLKNSEVCLCGFIVWMCSLVYVSPASWVPMMNVTVNWLLVSKCPCSLVYSYTSH